MEQCTTSPDLTKQQNIERHKHFVAVVTLYILDGKKKECNLSLGEKTVWECGQPRLSILF